MVGLVVLAEGAVLVYREMRPEITMRWSFVARVSHVRRAMFSALQLKESKVSSERESHRWQSVQPGGKIGKC